MYSRSTLSIVSVLALSASVFATTTQEPDVEPFAAELMSTTTVPEPVSTPTPTQQPTDAGTLPPFQIPSQQDLVISAGFGTTCVMWKNYGVKCFGFNAPGSLGYGDNVYRGDGPNEMGPNLPYITFPAGFKPRRLSVGIRFGCARSANKEVACWGEGSFGGAGQETPSDSLVPAIVSVDMNVRDLYVGGNSAAVVSPNQKNIKMWGSNMRGQLGTDRIGLPANSAFVGDQSGEMDTALPHVDLGTNWKILDVAVGELHSCAILKPIGARQARNPKNALKCWGENLFGQLGLGDEEQRNGAAKMGNVLEKVKLGGNFEPEMVAVGSGFTCVANSAGKLKCFGGNTYGQLGLGDDVTTVGRDPADMGGALKRVKLGAGFDVAQIGAGRDFACALSTDNRVKCWGGNTEGQLGQGHTDPIGLVDGDMGNNLDAIEFGSNFTPVQLAVGYFHACVLSSQNKIKCWGDASSGALGYENAIDQGITSGQMGNNLPEVAVF